MGADMQAQASTASRLALAERVLEVMFQAARKR